MEDRLRMVSGGAILAISSFLAALDAELRKGSNELKVFFGWDSVVADGLKVLL